MMDQGVGGGRGWDLSMDILLCTRPFSLRHVPQHERVNRHGLRAKGDHPQCKDHGGFCRNPVRRS